MNYATAAASKPSHLTTAGPTAVRIGQVEQALGVRTQSQRVAQIARAMEVLTEMVEL